MTHINHIREMSTATIQHDAKDIEVLTSLIDAILTGNMGAVSNNEADALVRLHDKLKTASPDMIF